MFLTRIVEDEHRGSIRHNNGEKKRTIIQDKGTAKCIAPRIDWDVGFFLLLFLLYFSVPLLDSFMC